MTTREVLFVLRCRYPFAPGYEWSAELKVSNSPGGFAVTGFLGSNDEGVRRIVGKEKKPLTWRNLAAWLENNDEAGLTGDVLAWIESEAPTQWQGEMLGWSWICHERPEEALYAFLLRCSDDELGELWEANKAITRGDAWEDLTQFAAAADEAGLLELSYQDVLKELGMRRPATPALLRERAELRLKQEVE